MKAYFVTGTDTGVGKTTVSCALLAAAARNGMRAVGLKPAESGCPLDDDGIPRPLDALALQASGNVALPLEVHCPYRFLPAVAPGVAAAGSGVSIDIARIQQCLEQARNCHPDLLLVEGAGGLLVPFGAGLLIADLAAHLELPLLVVARPDLGTINHTLLTLEVARLRGLQVIGFAFSSGSAALDKDFVASNVAEIQRVDPTKFLGCLPFISSLDSPSLAQAGAELLHALPD